MFKRLYPNMMVPITGALPVTGRHGLQLQSLWIIPAVAVRSTGGATHTPSTPIRAVFAGCRLLTRLRPREQGRGVLPAPGGVGPPTTWTIFQHDGPNHLGL